MAKPLNILYISHYFPPEVNAPAARVSEMSSRWIRKGARVTVLTGFPNHPTGIIPEKYRRMRRTVEAYDGVKVVRTWMYAAANKGFFRRILNYLSFMISAIVLGTTRVGKPDIIIATSPQFFVAVAGYVLSRIKRCKFVFEIRDLWPEEIVAVGAIKNRLLIRMLESLALFLYRKADLLVPVAQGTIELLEKRSVPRDKMVLIQNGVSLDEFSLSGRGEAIRAELGLAEKFVVGYIGTHGMAHRLETVLHAAELLKAQSEIHFVFVGDGAEKKKLTELATRLRLNNVTFHDQVARELVGAYYQACSVCLVPLRKADLFTKNIPSKIYEIMASCRPIIASTLGESRALIERSGAGLGAAPEDPEELAAMILKLYREPSLCSKMGQDGYTFALANCSRTRQADLYLEYLHAVVTGHRISHGLPTASRVSAKPGEKSPKSKHRHPVSL